MGAGPGSRVEGPPQVGGGFGGAAGAGPGSSAISVTHAEPPDVLDVHGVCVDLFLPNGETCIQRGEGLGKLLLVAKQAAETALGNANVSLKNGFDGVGVSQPAPEASVLFDTPPTRPQTFQPGQRVANAGVDFSQRSSVQADIGIDVSQFLLDRQRFVEGLHGLARFPSSNSRHPWFW